MITEDYVSFEAAKLLKEKGFNGKCSFVVNAISKGVMPVSWPTTNSDIEEETNLIALPTLQMVMKWLREEKNIAIIPVPYSFTLNGEIATWVYSVYNGDKLEINSAFFTEEPLDSYEEACETAIKYCLENLI